MAEVTYPVYYQQQRMTLDQIRARFKPGCHPAVWRCIEALLVWGRGRWGIGGGGRKIQPDKPGFAPPGMSFHEWQTFASKLFAYSAFDLVISVPGGVHRAPTWTEARELVQFGLHAFISGEPWHAQRRMYDPARGDLIRGFRSWVVAGRPDPDHFPLPGQPVTPPPPPLAPDVPYAPPSKWWLFPLDASKPKLVNGSADDDVLGHVRYLQDAIWFGAGGDIHRDGEFGNETERRLNDVLGVFDLPKIGRLDAGGPGWRAIDFLVGLLINPDWAAPTPAPENHGVTAVSPCLYYVRPDDSPWRTGERVYGSGLMGAQLLTARSFSAPHVHIPIPQVAGITTAVRPDEGAIAVVKRMTGGREPLATFYDWNGGEDRTLHPGDVVHIPTAA